jgi:antirestriction protein
MEGDIEISTEQYLDSREIQDRIDYLEALDEPEDYEREELEKLQTFKDEVSSSEWDYGITFIREEDFEDYARELAEDIGAVGKDNQWPVYCIDWEWAARELQMDYGSAELDGVTYLFHS